jgi:sialate O-acetylesterase
MIYPIASYHLAGAVWYQGETNVPFHSTYARLLRALVAGWRKSLGQNFSFYIVQIAPWTGYPDKDAAALLREAQADVGSDPGNGVIAIHDLVDTLTELHPKMKKEVGERLAFLATDDHYHLPEVKGLSPQFESLQTIPGRLVLSFTQASRGIEARNGAPCCFEIAGADGNFVVADAKIKSNTVIVWSKGLPKPLYVRYGFHNDSRPNLFGSNGLPVLPFRTDRQH